MNFILGVLTDKINIKNDKKSITKDIINFTNLANLNPIEKTEKAEKTEKTENSGNLLENLLAEIKNLNTNKDISKIDDSYDYLLRMSIFSLTYEKVKELIQDIKKSKSQIKKLNLLTEKELWITDINNFEKTNFEKTNFEKN